MRRQLTRKATDTLLALMICATLCGETVAQDKADYANGDASNGFSAQAYPMSQNGWARNGFTAEERDKLIAAGFPNGDEAIKWSSVLSKAGQVAPDVIGTYYKAGKHFGFDAADLGAIFDAVGRIRHRKGWRLKRYSVRQLPFMVEQMPNRSMVNILPKTRNERMRHKHSTPSDVTAQIL